MNDIERAIDSAMHSINMLLKADDITYKIYATLRDALHEKAEREKMRCENCKYFTIYGGGTCEGEHLCEFIRVNKTDFCSYFEPKESEGKTQ